MAFKVNRDHTENIIRKFSTFHDGRQLTTLAGWRRPKKYRLSL